MGRNKKRKKLSPAKKARAEHRKAKSPVIASVSAPHRTPAGRLSRSSEAMAQRGERKTTAVALAQPHRRIVPKDKRTDQRLATVLGRLNVFGLVLNHEHEAGERFRSLHDAYLRELAAPMTRVSAGMAYVSERVEAAPEASFPAREVPETDEERKDRIVGAFNAAQKRLALCRDHHQATRELRAVVLEDREPVDLIALRQALQALARHWHIEAPEPRQTPPIPRIEIKCTSRVEQTA